MAGAVRYVIYLLLYVQVGYDVYRSVGVATVLFLLLLLMLLLLVLLLLLLLQVFNIRANANFSVRPSVCYTLRFFFLLFYIF